ncbi:MAG: hypothetical protein KatS3mg043_1150 [Rhodothermaceae bacterium]|nr:MAG: hypothetical protein KatS3mg043_1150 [Rhodothermaceae bacterium]
MSRPVTLKTFHPMIKRSCFTYRKSEDGFLYDLP